MDPPSWECGICARGNATDPIVLFQPVCGRSSREAADGGASGSHSRQRTD
jgi:hypothetical protein